MNWFQHELWVNPERSFCGSNTRGCGGRKSGFETASAPALLSNFAPICHQKLFEEPPDYLTFAERARAHLPREHTPTEESATENGDALSRINFFFVFFFWRVTADVNPVRCSLTSVVRVFFRYGHGKVKQKSIFVCPSHVVCQRSHRRDIKVPHALLGRISLPLPLRPYISPKAYNFIFQLHLLHHRLILVSCTS